MAGTRTRLLIHAPLRTLAQRGHVAHREPDYAVGAAIAVVLGQVQDSV